MSSTPGKKDDLDGNAPDFSRVALLLIDVINSFEYPGGDRLFDNARCIAPHIRDLKRAARAARVPAVYVNDNFGRWQSSFEQLLKKCLAPGTRARPFVEMLIPQAEDYFVLKPKHSGFYQTPLDLLLKHLGTKRLVLAGLCTNSCVLFTANDAYMRDLELYIPSDCVAAHSGEEHAAALDQMKTITKANVCRSQDIDFSALAR